RRSSDPVYLGRESRAGQCPIRFSKPHHEAIPGDWGIGTVDGEHDAVLRRHHEGGSDHRAGTLETVIQMGHEHRSGVVVWRTIDDRGGALAINRWVRLSTRASTRNDRAEQECLAPGANAGHTTPRQQLILAEARRESTFQGVDQPGY